MKENQINQKIILFVISFIFVFSATSLLLTNNRFQSSIESLIPAINVKEEDINPNQLISPQDLRLIMKKTNVKVVAVVEENTIDQFIPGTIKINFNDIVQTVDGVRGLLIDQKELEQLLSAKGITKNDLIVTYDHKKGMLSTRLWWTLMVYGHEQVKVLNGGFNQWTKEKFETTTTLKETKQANYYAESKKEKYIASLEDVLDSYAYDDVLILDVRSEKEYLAGHIPQGINIPWTESINSDGTFKSYQKLKQIYEKQGIHKDLRDIIVHCSLGSRASHTYFVLTELLGYHNVKLYDGSWEEYVQTGLPIE
jgi:thiosulfate/3-mercaptopyruvate sulfurtransferase